VKKNDLKRRLKHAKGSSSVPDRSSPSMDSNSKQPEARSKNEREIISIFQLIAYKKIDITIKDAGSMRMGPQASRTALHHPWIAAASNPRPGLKIRRK
jgi:hypothetical protein